MADTLDFLLEIGCEEMPSAPLNNAVSQLAPLMQKGLDELGLSHGDIQVVSSPRRLAVLVHHVATMTKEVCERRRGPAADIAFDDQGNPTGAAAGFARKCGIDVSQLVCEPAEDGRSYVFAVRNEQPQSAAPLLSELCVRIISGLNWPNYRSQRWGMTHQTFVRPIRWLVALLGDEVLPVCYADVQAGSTTRGHRVLAPGEHEITCAANYLKVLQAAYVMTQDQRREHILAGIAKIEASGVHVDVPHKVLDEVVNLCEWPEVLVGSFDREFLDVPHEIICESMLSNQRYFPIYDAHDLLTQQFVIVSNAAPQAAEHVIDGNERVVRARLYDAKFFYDEDLKVSLETFRERLARVGFQERLGSMLQKAERIEDVALSVAREARAGAQVAAGAQRAAHLCKADLVSGAVVEFTSQQGVMGGYYALAAGEPSAVAEAIRDHYRPRFAGDDLPVTFEGCIVAVADKIDTIVGMFAIDEPPTGSKDPFALRRSAIGILNILRERLGCGYEGIVEASARAYAEQGLVFDHAQVCDAVKAFIKGRMEQIARDLGARPDTIAAVSAGNILVPQDFFALVQALDRARTSGDVFADLAGAYVRAAHLADAELGGDVDSELLAGAETELLCAINEVQHEVDSRLAQRDFDGIIEALASLRAPIDRFFDEVMVMDEDLAVRSNRLKLLNRFVGVFTGIADIGELASR